MQNRSSPYKKSQSLARGLSLLHALSKAPSGSASISELSQAQGLHRTTVRRLLQTLLEEGYVQQSYSDNRYRLSHKIRELSDGYTDEEWISEVAAPAMAGLLQKTFWPSDLCTLDGAEVVIRETTHRFSALSFHRGMIGKRLPLLFTAAGRAYFCFCSDQERQQLLALIQAENSLQSRIAENTTYISQLISKTREQGYASNEGDWDIESNAASIALPIFYKNKILSTINLVFLKKILSPAKAAEQFLPHLKETVRKIENELLNL